MKKIVFIPLIVGGLLAATGGILVGCSWKNTFTITNTHDLSGKTFSKIALDLDTSNVEFVVSEEAKVICLDTKKVVHEVKVENDTLSISMENNRKWFNLFDPTKKVTVYTPLTSFTSLNVKLSTGDIAIPSGFTFGNSTIDLSTGDVEFKANVENKLSIVQSTGDLKLENVSAKEMYLESSTGKKTLNSVNVSGDVEIKSSTGKTLINKLSCHNLTINASTGDIDASEAVLSGDLFVKVSTGDVTFKNSDAQKISIETSTGDVELSLLSSHSVAVKSDTGKVDYPAHSTGPDCDIKTDTGNVKVSFVS